MDRRRFIAKGLGAVAGTSRVASQPLFARETSATPSPHGTQARWNIHRYRFGVNYTPSHNWWFCWNDWNTAPIERDLDAIAALGADHLRVLLIWPYFQPNPNWVSPAHLERLEQLLLLMAPRGLDAVVTVFTGQLSGLYFLPPFNTPAFYTDNAMIAAQELFIRELARVVGRHSNIIGCDLGNELNTCWRADPAVGDIWMARLFSLLDSVCPDGLHVNGTDHSPWFEPTTFSAHALAARKFPVIHSYPYWAGALKYGGPMDPPSTKLVAAMATLARAYARDPAKPVWAEEFNTCFLFMTAKQQAQWLESAVLESMGAGVSWFTYWDSHDVDRRFGFNSLEYSLGLLTNDGQVKEQGRMFKQLADAYRGKPVVFPAAALPVAPQNSTASITWQWMLDWMGWKSPGAAGQRI